jgi:ribosomal protein L32
MALNFASAAYVCLLTVSAVSFEKITASRRYHEFFQIVSTIFTFSREAMETICQAVGRRNFSSSTLNMKKSGFHAKSVFLSKRPHCKKWDLALCMAKTELLYPKNVGA